MKGRIVSQLPDLSSLLASAMYFIGKDGGFEMHVTDDNKQVRKLLSLGDAPNDTKQYVRESGAWKVVNNPFDFKGATELGTTDLNTVLTPGVYYQSSASNATKARNYPLDNIRGGSLRVLPVSRSGQTIVHQLYISGGTDGSGGNELFYREEPRVFLRKYVNGNWVGGWFELTNNNRVLNQTVATFATDSLIEGFTQDGATVLLPAQNATITVKKDGRRTITYVQTGNNSVTFNPDAGLSIVGGRTYSAKEGRVIKVVISENKAFIQSGDEGDFVDAPSDNKDYVRKNGAWSLLDFFLTSKGVQELGTQNLDDLKSPGVYRQNRKEDTTLSRKYPTENIRGGTLWVLPISESPLIVHQLFVAGGTSTSGENTVFYHEHSRVFMRKWVRSQKWSEWVELTSTQRVLTATTNSFTTKTQFNEFTQDKATVILPATTATITVEGNTRQKTTYVQSENVAVNFTAGSGVTIVGDRNYAGKKGTVINLVIIDNTAYLSSSENGGISDAPSDGKEYLRFNNIWKEFTGWQFTELGVQNLNDVKTPGFYGKVNSSEVTAARNYPNSNVRGGHLLVLPMTLGRNLTIFQVYFSAGTKNSGGYTNSARIFMRAFVNNLEWLPWREFDGGKVHNVTENSLNLANAYKGFPVDNSVFVLNQATNISVPNSVLRCRFIKNTSGDITFTKASGVTIIGKEFIDLPEGVEISLVCNGSRAYINTGSGESVSVNHDIGSWD